MRICLLSHPARLGSWCLFRSFNCRLSGGNRCAGDRQCIGARLHVGSYLTLLQTLVMGIAMMFLARHELIASFRHWRKAWPVGLFGAITTAFGLRLFNAECCLCAGDRTGRAFDNAGCLSSVFKEKDQPNRMLAVLLLGASILLVLLDT